MINVNCDKSKAGVGLVMLIWRCLMTSRCVGPQKLSITLIKWKSLCVFVGWTTFVLIFDENFTRNSRAAKNGHMRWTSTRNFFRKFHFCLTQKTIHCHSANKRWRNSRTAPIRTEKKPENPFLVDHENWSRAGKKEELVHREDSPNKKWKFAREIHAK